jgi:hypothetical protein
MPAERAPHDRPAVPVADGMAGSAEKHNRAIQGPIMPLRGVVRRFTYSANRLMPSFIKRELKFMSKPMRLWETPI